VGAVTQADIHKAAERIFGDGQMLTVIAGRPTGV
jgi:zinc protease